MNDIISPDVLTTLVLAFGLAAFITGADWVIELLQRPRKGRHVAAE